MRKAKSSFYFLMAALVIHLTVLSLLGCSTEKIAEEDLSVDGLKPVVSLINNRLQKYEVNVFPNRVVIFNGLDYVKNIGQYKYRLSNKNYSDLLEAFKTFRFNEIHTGVEINITDNLLATISIDTRQKSKRDFYEPTKEYILFRRALEHAMMTENIRCPYIENHPIYGARDICEYEKSFDEKFLRRENERKESE